ncbi:hypothetical protein [Paraburkholderia hospita]|uniref:hypothetical protein n=1 Tax=Paraburkholderia hospita TaxID=169430 RepID=UPI001ABEA9D5|nr:hypothetical protein [Paraburkholderia hospita]
MSHEKNLFGIALDMDIGDRPRDWLLEASAMTRPPKRFDLWRKNVAIEEVAVVMAAWMSFIASSPRPGLAHRTLPVSPEGRRPGVDVRTVTWRC